MKIATTVKMGGSGNTRVAGIKKKKRRPSKISSLVSISPSFCPILVKTGSLLLLTLSIKKKKIFIDCTKKINKFQKYKKIFEKNVFIFYLLFCNRKTSGDFGNGIIADYKKKNYKFLKNFLKISF